MDKSTKALLKRATRQLHNASANLHDAQYQTAQTVVLALINVINYGSSYKLSLENAVRAMLEAE